MRPIGSYVCWFAALISSVANAQTDQLNYPAPTIHTSGQHASAIPLPPLPNSNAASNSSDNSAIRASTNYAANAGWVSGPAINSPTSSSTNSAPSSTATAGVVPASYAAPLANSETLKQPAVRTPLNPPKSQAALESSKSSSGNTVRMILSVGSSLLIVIGLFLGVAWCYRKTLSTSMSGIPKHVVSVLGRTAIAPRQQLVLVRFGSKLVLVSMVQGEARTISEITDPIEVDQLAGACESHQPHSLTNSFRSILNQNGGGAI